MSTFCTTNGLQHRQRTDFSHLPPSLGAAALARAAPIPVDAGVVTDTFSLDAIPSLPSGDLVNKGKAVRHHSADEASSDAIKVEELRTRMNMGGGDALFDAIKGLSLTPGASQPTVPSLNNLHPYTSHRHTVTHANPLAQRHGDSSHASLVLLPEGSSLGLLPSRQVPPHPSTYELLTPEGRAAYKKDRGISTVVGDKAYKNEWNKQRYWAQLRHDREFMQTSALKHMLQYHDKCKDNPDYKRKRALKQRQYHERNKDNADYKQRRALREQRRYQTKKAFAQAPSDGQPALESSHLTALKPVDSAHASASALSSSTLPSTVSKRKTAASSLQGQQKRIPQSAKGTQAAKRKNVAQLVVASPSSSEVDLSTTIDHFDAYQSSSSKFHSHLAQPSVPQTPETSLAPTLSGPRMSDQEMLELAKQLLLADSP